MRKLYIIGAGQFGREVWGWLSEVKDQSCTFAGFLDDNAQALDGFDVDAKVVAPIAGFKVSKGDCFACAISKPQVKAKLVAPFLAQGADFVNLIHTTAIISRGAILGVGNIFYPFVYIATNARLGNFITLNVASGAGHDCVIGDYSTLSGHCDVIVVDGRTIFTAIADPNPQVQTYMTENLHTTDVVVGFEAARIAELDGEFVALRHDPATHSLQIVTDRFGLFPFYSTHRSGRLYLSHSLGALIARGLVDGQLDFDALSDILAFNVPLDQRTQWRGVTGFAGGTEVVVNLDTLEQTTRRIWNPVNLLKSADRSFASVKDRLVELFLEGVEHTVRNQEYVAVTLSGGADSRCNLAASSWAERKTVTYSTGVPGSRAVAYARRMAELCGVAHYSHPLDGSFLQQFPALMRQSIVLMEGMSFASEVEASWLRDHVTSGGVMLHGAFAELYKIGKMHSFHYDAEIARLTGPAVADQLWKRFAGRYALRRDGFDEAIRQQLGEKARVHLHEKVASYQADLDTAGVLQMLYIDEFLGKVARGTRLMWNRRIPVCFPFAYPPLVDLILQVRTEDKISNQFVAHLLKQTNTILARFPDSNTGAPIGASRLKRELIHIHDWAKSRLFDSKARADHQDFADWLSRMQPDLETVFAELHSSTGAFDAEHLAKLTRQCRSGDDPAGRTLQFLWAWGLWKTESSPCKSGLTA